MDGLARLPGGLSQSARMSTRMALSVGTNSERDASSTGLRKRLHARRDDSSPSARTGTDPTTARRVARNFAALSMAEVVCRATSVMVTLYLAAVLEPSGYGRIEFAFQLVVWLVLLVRDGLEMIVTREIARHPRLVRVLVNQVLAFRLLMASGLFALLSVLCVVGVSEPAERSVLWFYGLLLLTTALGMDYVFRARERMGLVAISLVARTMVYALAVAVCVVSPAGLTIVPICLVAGEACGIALVWTCYVREHGWPRPRLSRRFVGVCLTRGRSIYTIQLCQTVLSSIDLMVVGVLSQWADVGRYGAPHRIMMALLTFGLIFQQAVFPSLARSWRDSLETSRRTLDTLIRVLVLGLLPIAAGVSALAPSLVALLLPASYGEAGLLLALGIWRAPLLTLAYLLQTKLVALNREATGAKSLLVAALVSVPLITVLRIGLGLPGAALAALLVAIGLLATGHLRMRMIGRAPSWAAHLRAPVLAVGVMIPVCWFLNEIHLVLAIAGGAIVYAVMLVVLGGVRWEDLDLVLGRRKSGQVRPASWLASRPGSLVRASESETETTRCRASE